LAKRQVGVIQYNEAGGKENAGHEQREREFDTG